ncbi:MAG: hypothetical protein ABMA14_28980 [Hyphomonadaceae bacterium]
MKGLFAAIAMASTVLLAPVAGADPLNLEKMQAMVTGMGHTPKQQTKADGTPSTTFEITITTEGFNVPIGVEISPSGRYIWCKASLGKSQLTSDDAMAVLKRLSSVQPTTVWITSSDILMMGIAIDNRDVTPEHLKYIFDKLAADVGNMADLWQKPAATPAPQ